MQRFGDEAVSQAFRPLPLPCAKITNPEAPAGTGRSPIKSARVAGTGPPSDERSELLPRLHGLIRTPSRVGRRFDAFASIGRTHDGMTIHSDEELSEHSRCHRLLRGFPSGSRGGLSGRIRVMALDRKLINMTSPVDYQTTLLVATPAERLGRREPDGIFLPLTRIAVSTVVQTRSAIS